jgi:lipopolysaccharide transport system ATP-binding protein
MCSDLSISLKNISKVYKRYHHPADRLKELLFPGKPRSEEFWALRDINLDISKGETVGIIGRNGSGKSTLLQIIVGTLQPTSGIAKVEGRVSALLELGSGFNPEFTGRQNVFFNGRILGLSQEEIANQFDEIAAFADIGEFLDQPVKAYSSGMFVRLAFAVAVHVEPEILVVDEALAVGDEAFQRKCFARIDAIREAGASVLFVSHSATSIVELCNRAILLDHGEILLQGLPKVAVSNYHKLIYAPANQAAAFRERLKQKKLESDVYTQIEQPKPIVDAKQERNFYSENVSKKAIYDSSLKPQHAIRYESQGAKIERPHITTLEGDLVNLLLLNRKYSFNYSVTFMEDCFKVRFGMLFKTVSGFEVGGSASHPSGSEISFISAGTSVNVEFRFSCLLLPGTYFLNAGVVGRVGESETYLDRCIDAVMFKVQPEVDLCATGIVDFGINAEIVNLPLVEE